MNTYKVLSIDAWGNKDDGFEWNQWFNAGTIDLADLNDNDAIIWAMYKNDFINSVNGADIEDDGYNVVIVDEKTREPLFAIEYGSILC
jgi:hypothetical protein